MDAPSSRITDLLLHLDLHDPDQAAQLLGLVYDELRRIAARHLGHEQTGHTLQPTDLVHEVWLRLSTGASLRVESRAHFYRIAARAMRQVLVDAARYRLADKRGGNQRPITLDGELAGELPGAMEFLPLHHALERLESLEPRLGQLVELRFFTGLTLDEAADTLGVSRRTAAKDWAAARLWLHRELAA